MSLPHVFRRAALVFLLGWPCFGVAAPGGEDRVLTDAEFAGLERENAMWRLMKPEEGVAANVARLRQAGYSEKDVATVQPQLAALWAVPYARNYGWLREETIERIRVIDRQFISRMRMVQLYRQTGVQVGEGARESIAYLNRQWRNAILEALDPSESAEFRFVNSPASRDEMRLTRGLSLTTDEQRTLFEWRRDYDGRHGASLASTSGLSRWQREGLLEQCARIRHLLGDERFAVYFSRLNPGFEKTRTTLMRLGETDPAVMVDIWWLRQKEIAAIDAIPGLKAPERSELVTRVRRRAADRLGETRLEAYLDDEDGRWLADAPRRRVVRAARPEALTAP